MSKSTVTAAAVRSFYRADEKRMSRLSPEAQASVRPGARGRLHPEVVADHNSKRRSSQYVLGSTTEAMAARKAKRAEMVAQGLAGTRGPVKGSGGRKPKNKSKSGKARAASVKA